MLPATFITVSAPSKRGFRGSIAQPTRAPVNACAGPSRDPRHDSGSGRGATPFPVELFHLPLLADYRRIDKPLPYSRTLTCLSQALYPRPLFSNRHFATASPQIPPSTAAGRAIAPKRSRVARCGDEGRPGPGHPRRRKKSRAAVLPPTPSTAPPRGCVALPVAKGMPNTIGGTPPKLREAFGGE